MTGTDLEGIYEVEMPNPLDKTKIERIRVRATSYSQVYGQIYSEFPNIASADVNVQFIRVAPKENTKS